MELLVELEIDVGGGAPKSGLRTREGVAAAGRGAQGILCGVERGRRRHVSVGAPTADGNSTTCCGVSVHALAGGRDRARLPFSDPAMTPSSR
jgi:hypothetical protein